MTSRLFPWTLPSLGLLLFLASSCAELKLTVIQPKNNERFASGESILVSGEVKDIGSGFVSVDKQRVAVEEGRFQTQIRYAPGPHQILIEAKNDQESSTVQRTIRVLPEKPQLILKNNPQHFTRDGRVQLIGEVKSSSSVLTLETSLFPPQTLKSKSFKRSWQAPPKSQRFTVYAKDDLGQRSPTIEQEIIYDPKAPQIKRLTPINEELSAGETLFPGHPALEFQIDDEHLAKIVLNGKELESKSPRVRISSTQIQQSRHLSLQAIDKAGNQSEVRYRVLSDKEWRARIKKTRQSLQDKDAWQKEAKPDKLRALKDIERAMNGKVQFLELKRFRCGGLSHDIGVYRHKKSGVILHLVPGGRFQMGSKLRPDEQPIKTVTLPPFFLAQREVTKEQWDRLLSPQSPNPSSMPKGQLSWLSAKTWLDKAELRFPSESEWEYACRAGSTSAYYWGDKDEGDWSWNASNSGGKCHSSTAHSAKANAFGLVDVLGNLWEFCADDYLDSYKNHSGGASPQKTSSTLPTNDQAVVGRGGSYKSPKDESRSAFRGLARRDLKAPDHGLRPALSLP